MKRFTPFSLSFTLFYHQELNNQIVNHEQTHNSCFLKQATSIFSWKSPMNLSTAIAVFNEKHLRVKYLKGTFYVCCYFFNMLILFIEERGFIVFITFNTVCEVPPDLFDYPSWNSIFLLTVYRGLLITRIWLRHINS